MKVKLSPARYQSGDELWGEGVVVGSIDAWLHETDVVSMRPKEVNPPLTESDRRPNDRPFYIDECCQHCGTILVYDDLLCEEPDAVDWDEIFFDEFSCPQCQNGACMDWPPEEIEEFKETFSC